MAGCFAGVTVAGDDEFSGSMDHLSGVAGVVGATVGDVVVCGTVAVVSGSNSLGSSSVW